MERLKKLLEEASFCRNWRKDTDSCNTGCPKVDVIRNNACPWSDNWDRADEECPCYR